MIEIEAVKRFEAINGKGMNMPEEVIPFLVKAGANIAAARSQICIRANSRLDNPDNKLAEALNEADLLIASGYAITGKISEIKNLSGQSESHIINSMSAYPIYAAEVQKVPGPGEIKTVFDQSTIAAEMLSFHIRAKKLTALSKRRINST